MRLTDQQRADCEALWPLALHCARRAHRVVGGDREELAGAASLALCKAVACYRPGELSLRSFVFNRVYRALGKVIRKRSNLTEFITIDMSGLSVSGNQEMIDELEEFFLRRGGSNRGRAA